MYVNVNVSTCIHRTKPASHPYHSLASTTLAPVSAVPETDATPLMSGHDLSVQAILPSLMPTRNAKWGAAGPGLNHIPSPPTPLLQEGKWALLKPDSHQCHSPLCFQGLLHFFSLSNFPGLSLGQSMARLASSHKADVRFGAAAPRELGYAVPCQSPAVVALMLQDTMSSKWQGGTAEEHISLDTLGGPNLLTALIWEADSVSLHTASAC